MLALILALVVAQTEPAPAANSGPAPVLAQPVWLRLPPPEWFEKFYPPEAAKARIEGRATMQCHVNRRGLLVDCAVIEEVPSGAGFGDAVLKLAPHFSMRPTTADGQPVEGGVVRIPVRFQLPVLPATDASTVEAKDVPWRNLPSPEDFARVFPDGATRRDLQGDVVLDCVIGIRGELACQVAAESPPAEGFGAAGLKLATKLTVRIDSAPSLVGRHVRIPLRFNLVKR